MVGIQRGARASTRRSLNVIVLTICAALGLALVGATALAKKPAKTPKAPQTSNLTVHTPVTPGSGYLALGDSVTFGYEESQVVPAPNYPDASSFIGYPELLGSELHLTVANPACPGETSSSLISATAQSNGCENAPGNGPAYRTMFPLHVKYTGSQLDYAVSYLKAHKNVRLVSLMIGANDGFVCQETTADHCASATETSAVSATITKNVATILGTIRSKAHYGGQIAIVNYYSLNYSSAATTALSTTLNTAQDKGAKPFHVVIADGFGELQAAALHSGGNSCTAGLLTQLSTGGCGIHPSYAGQSLLAQAVEKAIHIS
jgi:lysophospholipase L1-like esterase